MEGQCGGTPLQKTEEPSHGRPPLFALCGETRVSQGESLLPLRSWSPNNTEQVEAEPTLLALTRVSR